VLNTITLSLTTSISVFVDLAWSIFILGRGNTLNFEVIAGITFIRYPQSQIILKPLGASKSKSINRIAINV
jgi:hypothetical protein